MVSIHSPRIASPSSYFWRVVSTRALWTDVAPVFRQRALSPSHTMKELLLADLSFHFAGRLWLEGPTDRFMGIGRLELLGHIERLGSISKAAQAMNMSYKRAWDLVASLNAQARTPLVSTQTGGARGGGAVLTPAGQQVLAEFGEVQARFEQFLADETARLHR